MSVAYIGYRFISRSFGVARRLVPEVEGLRVLMYHAIGGEVADDPKRLYSLPRDAFERHMQSLARHERPSFVRLEKSCPAGTPGTSVAITFDDGYRDNLTVAAPILAALSIPFSVFVIAEAVRHSATGFLSPPEVRRLCEEYGAVIGSHGATHARLGQCGDAMLREELVSSKAYLEDLLGRPVTTLSYPHGSVDRRVRDAAQAAGYVLGMTSFFGANGADADPLLLNRLPVMRPDGPSDVQAKLAGHWDWYRWRQRAARRAAGLT